MRIAIPIVDERLSMHFGHCEKFAIVDVDSEAKSVLDTRYLVPPAHEPGVLPRWLREQGANLIIAGGMGSRAQGLFAEAGIDVVVGAPQGEPESLVRAYLNETLPTGLNVCDH